MLLSPEFFFQAELKFSLLKCSILWFFNIVTGSPTPASGQFQSVAIDSFKNFFCC